MSIKPPEVTPPRRTPAPTVPSGREHERFLAAIVDGAEDAIFAKTLQGVIMSWNPGAQRMYGYTPDDIVGRTVYDLVPADLHEQLDGIMAKLRRGEPIEHFETERVRANGQRFPVSLAISPVRNEAGEIIGASTIARDITVQRQLAESLNFQKSLLTAESESTIDGVLIIDPDGRVILANRRLAEMWKLQPDDVQHASERGILALLASNASEPEEFVRGMVSLNSEAEETSLDEVRLRDGRVFDRYTAPVRGQDGRLFGRLWSFRDATTERIRLAQLRAVMAALDDGAMVFDPGGRLLLRNPAALSMLPSVERFDQLRDLVGPQAGEDSSPTREQLVEGEHPLRTAIGDRWVRISTHPIEVFGSDAPADTVHTDARGLSLGSLVLIRDVTEVRDVEASRDAFVGILSHELRTPITTIFAAARMLERRPDEQSRLELIRDIDGESDRLYRLVEDLLVLTRIERDSLEITDEPVLVAPIIQRISAAERAQAPRIEIDITIENDLPMARGEPTYVEQILRNLVGNAVKYGPPDGRVQVVASRTADRILIAVRDQGPGIVEAESERVFELLYRSPVTAAQAAGSGIGLFVSRRLAQAMGGGVTARSRREGGAEFTLELPLYSDESDDDVIGHAAEGNEATTG